MLIGKLYRRGEEKERKGKGKEKETKRTGGGMERKGKERKKEGKGREEERRGKERKGRRRALMICFNSSCKKRVTRREGPGSSEEPFRVDLLMLYAFQNTPKVAKKLQS